jgi:competence protein ComEC
VTRSAVTLWKAVAVSWPAAWIGFGMGGPGALVMLSVAGAALAIGGRRCAVMAVVAVLSAGSGLVSNIGDRAQLEGIESDSSRVSVAARAVTDPIPSRFGWRQVVTPWAVYSGDEPVAWRGPNLSVATPAPMAVAVGDHVRLSGRIEARPTFVGRVPVAGIMTDPDHVRLNAAQGPLRSLANVIRERVLSDLDRTDRGEALLSGFLVGETSGVSDSDLDSLRRSGLTHYVAVSGSNVAVFLGLWWLVLAPMARFPRWRAGSGLVGVVVFVLVTRAEPSVVRAGAMVSVLLVGKLFGWAFDRWTALALGVLGCLAVSGRLAADVGFQLSVAATAGVMWGAGRLRFEPRPVATVVGASVSAQVAVAPILLGVFGTMPLLSPLANLVAAPVVSAATVTGGLGALLGWRPLVVVGATLADVVLFVAELAAPWPQAGPLLVGVVAVASLAAWRWRRLRPALALSGALAVAAVVAPFGPALDRPSVVFLDIGQGDSELILADGFTVLIDGGPDPVLLARKLDEYGVGRVDLLIVSHVHADHIEGLRAVVGRGVSPSCCQAASRVVGL